MRDLLRTQKVLHILLGPRRKDRADIDVIGALVPSPECLLEVVRGCADEQAGGDPAMSPRV